jgi:hypothetical protein
MAFIGAGTIHDPTLVMALFALTAAFIGRLVAINGRGPSHRTGKIIDLNTERRA